MIAENELKRYANLKKQIEDLDEEKETIYVMNLPDEILEQIGDIKEKIATLTAAADKIKTSVQDLVKPIGHSIESDGYEAQWCKPSPRWNDDQLTGYAAAGHPEILAFRKMGEPVVRVQTKKPKK